LSYYEHVLIIGQTDFKVVIKQHFNRAALYASVVSLCTVYLLHSVLMAEMFRNLVSHQVIFLHKTSSEHRKRPGNLTSIRKLQFLPILLIK